MLINDSTPDHHSNHIVAIIHRLAMFHWTSDSWPLCITFRLILIFFFISYGAGSINYMDLGPSCCKLFNCHCSGMKRTFYPLSNPFLDFHCETHQEHSFYYPKNCSSFIKTTLSTVRYSYTKRWMNVHYVGRGIIHI